MSRYGALLWVRWRVSVNQWTAKASAADRLSALLSQMLFATLSFVVGIIIAAIPFVLEADRNARRLFPEFSLLLLSLLFLFWILLPQRASGGIHPLENLLIFPVSLEELSAVSILNHLTSRPAVYLYPSCLGYVIGAFHLGRLMPHSFGFWIVVIEVLLFILLCVVMAEFLGNLMEIVFKKGAAATGGGGVQTGLVFMGLVFLVLFARFHGWVKASQFENLFRSNAWILWRYLPPGLLTRSVSSEIFHENTLWPHTLTLLIFLAIITGGYWLNFAVVRNSFLGGGTTKPPTGLHKMRVRESHWFPTSLISEQTSGVVEKELKCILRSPAGRLGVSMTIVVSAGSNIVFKQVEAILTDWNLVPPRVVESMSLMILWTFTNSLLFFYSSNCFGFDGKGLQNFFTGPIHGRRILLAKNFAWLVLSEFCLLFVIVVSLLGDRSQSVTNAAWLLLAFHSYLFISLILNNLLSIHYAVRVDVQRLRGNTQGKSMPMILTLCVWAFSCLVPLLLFWIASNLGTIAGSSVLGVGLFLAFALYKASLAFQEKSLRKAEERLLQAISWAA